jgi:hypothetical protein
VPLLCGFWTWQHVPLTCRCRQHTGAFGDLQPWAVGGCDPRCCRGDPRGGQLSGSRYGLEVKGPCLVLGLIKQVLSSTHKGLVGLYSPWPGPRMSGGSACCHNSVCWHSEREALEAHSTNVGDGDSVGCLLTCRAGRSKTGYGRRCSVRFVALLT